MAAGHEQLDVSFFMFAHWYRMLSAQQRCVAAGHEQHHVRPVAGRMLNTSIPYSIAMHLRWAVGVGGVAGRA